MTSAKLLMKNLFDGHLDRVINAPPLYLFIFYALSFNIYKSRHNNTWGPFYFY